MRVSCCFDESPRQYAPASPVSFSALIGFAFCRCGPRQRSVKSPCVYSEMSPSAVSTSSTLYGSPSAAKRAFASSREISSRDHSRPSFSSRWISASIFSRSSSWIGCGNSKS